jgi:GrpB-like predicted nucleotidyltransferase (UPF0157 family)
MPHNPKIHPRPYTLVDYDAAWPKLFKKYTAEIQIILGDDLLEIHHFGSTSIPGMFAKPNIDIYALARSLDAIRSRSDEMEAAGFTPRGDYSSIGEEYFTIDKPDGKRIASIHIFEGSNEVFTSYANFRDYLISNSADRNRYIALKKALYKEYPDDYPAYDEGKKETIDDIKAKANEWAYRKNK